MRKDGWTYVTTGLPDHSEALEDLQRLADELGVTKSEANRLLLIAYSKARRGAWSRLWGFPLEAPSQQVGAQAPQSGSTEARGSLAGIELQKRRRRGAAAAAALDFDE